MFELEKAIESWRRQLVTRGLKSGELLDELESHLREDVGQGVRSGMTAQRAFELAVQRLGAASALQVEFAKVSRPRWSWRRKLKRLLAGVYAAPGQSAGDFTAAALASLDFAREESERLHHDFIGTEHLLLGLLRPSHGVTASVLFKLGLGCELVRREIEKEVGSGYDRENLPERPFTPRARRALTLAASEARAMNHGSIGPAHIFLGLLLEGGGVAALVLKNLGVGADRARAEVLRVLGPNGDDGPEAARASG